MMSEFWNKRYDQEVFTYGEEPNEYVKAKLSQLKPGKILFPGEGEGRNAVYAAQRGWEAFAYDQSIRGKEKAEILAQAKKVTIDYRVHRLLEESYASYEFDAIVLTYVHPEPEVKREMHKRLDSYLKIGGHFILEAFSKEHREINKVNPSAGGPSDVRILYSVVEIKNDFPNYEMIELKRETVDLNEGFGHVGEASVVRFFGKKTRDRQTI